MAEKTSVVIPYKDAPGRSAGKNFVAAWHGFRADEVIVSECDSGLWNKSKAINSGVDKATGDVIVIADADAVICDGAYREAVRIARNERTFVLGANCICWMTQKNAEDFVRRNPSDPVSGQTYRKNRRWCKPYGGIWFLKKSIFLEVGGMDEGFIEWGYQDIAFHSRIVKSGVKRHRMKGPMFHIWHPVNPKKSSSEPINKQYFARHYNWVRS